jgi:hypothetical protein
MTRIVLGGSESERVELRFTFPAPAERDGWLETYVDIVVKGFRGSIRAFVEVHDLLRFGEQLAKVYESLSGRADLTPRESQILLAVEGNGRGGVTVKGTAYAEATYGNKLEFELVLDQTFLVEPLRVLRSIAEHAPSHGA